MLAPDYSGPDGFDSFDIHARLVFCDVTDTDRLGTKSQHSRSLRSYSSVDF